MCYNMHNYRPSVGLLVRGVKAVARTVKPPDIRRSEILDVAQELFYSRGYEQTSIRDIIETVGIAKGTFYHYFRSKQDLLDALTGRILQRSVQILEPMVEDGQLSALEKLQRLFADAGSLKLENQAFLRTLLPVWFLDDNAIVREKMKAASLREITPLLTQIIRQGVAEGSLTTDYPDDIGEIILQLGQNLSETVSRLLLEAGGDMGVLDAAQRKVAIYEDSITRLLGAPARSVKIVDIKDFRHWFE